jgi:general secretion pathway protein B
MSYILDALRRADAERERGAVPNIHAQPMQGPSNDGEQSRTTPPWLWIALALLAVAVLGLAWKLFASDAPREQVAAAPVAAAPTPAPAATAGTLPPPRSTSATPPPSPVPLEPVQPLPITPRAASAPSKVVSKPAPRTEQTPAAAAAAATATAAAPASTAASAVERIYAVSELPEDVRRSLPALPIGGAMYSKNAPDRMLIIGGQIMHEGDTIAPDLKLEQIRLKSAVLRYKAYRYEVSY